MLNNYDRGTFFDEMFCQADSSVFAHYDLLFKRFSQLNKKTLLEKQRLVDNSLLENGVTFTVYGDNRGTEKIFPIDLIPRIIPKDEWEKIEQGLTQRIIALNLFLNDIYNDAHIIKDGVIPESIVKSATHYRPEMQNLAISKDIYI